MMKANSKINSPQSHRGHRDFILLCALFLCGVSVSLSSFGQEIPQKTMQAIYDEVRTPYKYGLVVAPSDNFHKYDCPTVWREGEKWMMTYVCYDGKDGTDGRGYETWLAESDDLLHWTTLGRVLALPPTKGKETAGGAKSQKSPKSNKALWDENQRGGFPALIDWTWGGSYEQRAYKGRRWMTYIGGHGTGAMRLCASRLTSVWRGHAEMSVRPTSGRQATSPCSA